MIKKIGQVYALLNILSIDVALGAVVITKFFSAILDVHPRVSTQVVLGITVWMIYTVDHLLDARKLKREASTERHRFHQKYFKALIIALVIAVPIVISQLFFMRTAVLIGGLILSWIIVIYFLTLKKLKFLKELAGALLYSGGVLVAPLSLYKGEYSNVQILLIIQFVLTALINLLIFAWFDIEKDARDRRISFATYFGDGAAYKVFILLLVVNTIGSGYVFLQHHEYIWPELCILFMNAVLAALVFEKKYFDKYDRYRVLGDAIFFIPIGYLLLR